MLPQSIVDRFHDLMSRAIAAGETEPTAMSLATADAQGRPSVRTVLLKQFAADGLSFYSNAESQKGVQLAENPHAAICILWKRLDLQVQVRAEGVVERVGDAEADAYFASRPRGSQIGAWASAQSRTLEGRGELEDRIEAVERRYADQAVPRPGYWVGYRLVPRRVEFWFGGEFRLHDRIVFTDDGAGWQESRLFP